jgi:hypothetical protein
MASKPMLTVVKLYKAPADAGSVPATIGRLKGLRLATQITSLAEMPPESLSVVVGEDGSLWAEPITPLHREIEDNGTTPLMLAADAWKTSSIFFKAALLDSLRRVRDPRVPKLLDSLVWKWGIDIGREYKQQPEVDPAAAGSSSSDAIPHIHAESFDFIVSAFRCFVKEPMAFGWAEGSRHQMAITVLTAPIKEALKTELQGRWSAASTEEDWFAKPEPARPDANHDMSTRLFNILVDECYEALQVRQTRVDGAHPMGRRDPERMERMLKLYRKAVSQSAGVVGRFPHLAKAAVGHNTEKLREVKNEITQMHAAGSNCVVEEIDFR